MTQKIEKESQDLKQREEKLPREIEELIQAIHVVRRGETYLGQQITNVVVQDFVQPLSKKKSVAVPELTPREPGAHVVHQGGQRLVPRRSDQIRCLEGGVRTVQPPQIGSLHVLEQQLVDPCKGIVRGRGQDIHIQVAL